MLTVAVEKTCLEVAELDPSEPADLLAGWDPESDLDRMGNVVADLVPGEE